jgi:hypothetical protein
MLTRPSSNTTRFTVLTINFGDVSSYFLSCQALSVDPINGHVLDLLNLALESSNAKGPRAADYPGGEVAFKKAIATLQQKYKTVNLQSLKTKGKEPERLAGKSVEDEMTVG